MPWAIGDRIEDGTIIGIGKTKSGDLRYLVEYENDIVLVYDNHSLLSRYKPRIVWGANWRDGDKNAVQSDVG